MTSSVVGLIPVLLMGSATQQGCGVADSDAAWLLEARSDTIIHAMVEWRWWQTFALSPSRHHLIVAYPTAQRRATLRLPALLVKYRMRGSRAAVHLHEYSNRRAPQRMYIWLILALAGGRVVVSTQTELRALIKMGFGRRAAVCPPANGTGLAPRNEVPVREGVVGVFGTARSDKAVDELALLLAAVPEAVKQLEFVGPGWGAALANRPIAATAQPGAVVKRVFYGFVDAAALQALVSSWAYALAPLSDGATDKRMSVRVPLAAGVATLAPRPANAGDLTLRPRHLHLVSGMAVEPAISTVQDRVANVEACVRMESTLRKRLSELLLLE